MTAEMDEPFVVFLIGMRVNSYWKLHKWLPVAAAMPRMLRELDDQPDSGLLHAETTVNSRTLLMVQYWESFADIRAYARDTERAHVPAWVDYNRTSGRTGDVGIFHETYLVDPDDCENVYNNMPAFGLGGAGRLKPAGGAAETAAGRLGVGDDDPAVSEDGSVVDGDAAAETTGESMVGRLVGLLPFH
jgi:hypothetical protein